jgi:hypothetical protein
MLFAITFVLSYRLSVVPAANKQLQRTVIPRRWIAQRAAAELRLLQTYGVRAHR